MARILCDNSGVSMMQHTMVVRRRRMAYIILEAMLLLQLLGQH